MEALTAACPPQEYGVVLAGILVPSLFPGLVDSVRPPAADWGRLRSRGGMKTRLAWKRYRTSRGAARPAVAALSSMKSPKPEHMAPRGVHAHHGADSLRRTAGPADRVEHFDPVAPSSVSPVSRTPPRTSPWQRRASGRLADAFDPHLRPGETGVVAADLHGSAYVVSKKAVGTMSSLLSSDGIQRFRATVPLRAVETDAGACRKRGDLLDETFDLGDHAPFQQRGRDRRGNRRRYTAAAAAGSARRVQHGHGGVSPGERHHSPYCTKMARPGPHRRSGGNAAPAVRNWSFTSRAPDCRRSTNR